MTTNGHLLAELAAPLRAAGLSAVNVSLDTLDPERFRAITGRGDLARVLAGIDAAVAAGLRVKTNAVALRGDQRRRARRAVRGRVGARRGAAVHRAHADVGRRAVRVRPRDLPAAAIRRTLEAALGPLAPADGGARRRPARYWARRGDTAQSGSSRR